MSDLNAQRRFVFVANDAYAEPDEGESQDELQNKLASIVLEEGNTADLLAAAGKGIAMSGIAQSDGKDVVTITPGVKCEVHLQRIVARVDVQNNTPNLIIKSIELQQAAPKGYLFPHTPVAAADEGYITEAMNAQVNLGTTYAEQTDLKKVFYLYERANAEGNGAQVKVTYTINNSNGEVIVPFRKTSDDKSFVDIERNTLYTIILGNGEPITTNPVSFTLKVEDWNTVDMDEAVDPDEDEQAALNAALKVNMFTPYNAKEFDLRNKTITSFYDKLTVDFAECPTASYVTWSDLDAQGALTAEFTGPDGKNYRIPTAGESALLAPIVNQIESVVYYPYWNDQSSLVITEAPFEETLYFKNDANYADQSQPDDPEYTLTGTSQLKVGQPADEITYSQDGTYNIRPVYGLRFKGTDQYAAYRWESCKIESDPLQRYLSIKIKALSPQDDKTTIDDVANESFWSEGSYIEFKVPASGYYMDVIPDNVDDNSHNRGVFGVFWSSTLKEAQTAYRFGIFITNTGVGWNKTDNYYLPLRFVKVD